MSKKKAETKKQYVRRGFDIDLNLYNEMRAAAAELGMHTKDFLKIAIELALNQKKRGFVLE